MLIVFGILVVRTEAVFGGRSFFDLVLHMVLHEDCGREVHSLRVLCDLGAQELLDLEHASVSLGVANVVGLHVGAQLSTTFLNDEVLVQLKEQNFFFVRLFVLLSIDSSLFKPLNRIKLDSVRNQYAQGINLNLELEQFGL